MMVFLFAPKGKLAAKIRQHFDVRCGKPVPFSLLQPYFLYRIDGEEILGQIKPTKVMNGSTPKLMEYRRGREIYHEEVLGQAHISVGFNECLPMRFDPWGSSALVFFFSFRGRKGTVESSFWLPCEMEETLHTVADFIAMDKMQRERITRRN